MKSGERSSLSLPPHFFLLELHLITQAETGRRGELKLYVSFLHREDLSACKTQINYFLICTQTTPKWARLMKVSPCRAMLHLPLRVDTSWFYFPSKQQKPFTPVDLNNAIAGG